MGVTEIGLVQAFDGSARFGPAYVRDFAQAAEAVGFHSVWVPEHIVFFQRYTSVYPYPPEPGSTSSPQLPVGQRPALFDPLLTCQALALHTTTLRVGTAIALLPLRHPLLWAREVSTLDHFTGGRFELGVGVGWLAEEYAALGVPFAERGRVADEHLAALREIWATDDSSFHGATSISRRRSASRSRCSHRARRSTSAARARPRCAASPATATAGTAGT